MVKIIKQYAIKSEKRRIGEWANVSLHDCVSSDSTMPPDTFEEAQTDLTQAREKAQQEGYEQGLKQGIEAGLQQGLEQASSEQQDLNNQLESLLKALPQALQTHCKEQMPQAIDIVNQVLPTFFLHNAVNPKNIEHAIMQWLEQIHDQQDITVYLSQQDIQLFEKQKIQLNVGDSVTIKASDDVELGGCLIENAQGIYDGRLENQIEKLKEVLVNIKQQAADE